MILKIKIKHKNLGVKKHNQKELVIFWIFRSINEIILHLLLLDFSLSLLVVNWAFN